MTRPPWWKRGFGETVPVDKLAAVEQPNEQTPILGQLLWYTITDMDVTRAQLEGAFTAAGIDPAHLPKPIKAVDAFRRATSAAEMNRLPAGAGQFINLLVREISAGQSEVVRALVREVVDAQNVRLHYQEVATFNLARADGRMRVFPSPIATDQERAACERAGALYVQFQNSYNGRHLREVVHNILDACRPVAVRPSGGVYFVPQAHEAAVRRVKDLVARLADYGTTSQRSRLWTVPVIDLDEQRSMIQESLDDQVAGESKALLGEMADLLKSDRKITQLVATQFAGRVRKLGTLTAEYETLLGSKQDRARAGVELARAQVTALLQRVEVEASA